MAQAVDIARARIGEMIDKYSSGLDSPITLASANLAASKGFVILLTGSTGNLGAEILACLVQNENTERVFTFNRPSRRGLSLLQRHDAIFEDKGLDPSLLRSPKLVFLEGEATHPYLGLPSEIYEELLQSVTLVIHNAWRIDLISDLLSFEDNIWGLRNLIDLARAGRHASLIRFAFASSVSSAQAWNMDNGLVPERLFPDAQTALGNGYGESKYIAEQILAKSGLTISSLRIAQLCGRKSNGAWPSSDWMPMLLKVSLKFGFVPCGKGLASWIPVDEAAKVIVDIAMSDQPPSFANVVHPRPILVGEVLMWMRDAVIQQKGWEADMLPMLTGPEHLGFLESVENYTNNIDAANIAIPGLKMIKFFRRIALGNANIPDTDEGSRECGGYPTFESTNAQMASPVLKELPSLTVADVERWVMYWTDKGHLG